MKPGDNRKSPTSPLEAWMQRGVSPGALVQRVGRAFGALVSSRSSSARRRQGFGLEPLEGRQLLDGNFATALPIALDGNDQGALAGTITTLAGSDNDYFQFTAPGTTGETRFVSVLADSVNETPATTLNTRVQVFDQDGLVTPISSGTNNGTLSTGLARDGWAGFIAQAGRRYFVVVSSDTEGGGTTTGTYTLRINAANTLPDVNVSQQATNPQLGMLQAPDSLDIEPLVPIRGDIDRLQQDVLYRYVVPSLQHFKSTLMTFNAQSTQADLTERLDARLDIYKQNAGGFGVTRVAFDSDAGRLNDAFTTLNVRENDVLFIRVRSDEVRPSVPTTPTGLGAFWLVADAQAGELPQAINTITRRGSDAGTALLPFAGGPPADPDNPTPGFLTQSYRFTAQGSGLTIITAVGVGLDPVTDTALRLFDAQGALLAFNDNVSGTSAELRVQLTGGSEYFVVVDGFEVNNGTQFAMFVESNHTFDTLQPIDDHSNDDSATLTGEDLRRSFENATPIVFGNPALTGDANGNLVRDIGWLQTGNATGRIHNSGDTDVFQFTPPVDMLGTHAGSNDDTGTSLFVGGAFTRAGANPAFPTVSRTLTVFDALDYWYTGRQTFDAAGTLSNQPDTQFGFVDNPATAGTNHAEIYTLFDWDPTPGVNNAPTGMTDHVLVVGGDFQLVLPPANPNNPPVVLTNLAIWVQNWNTGEFFWSNALGDANGPVRAAATYDPPANPAPPPGTPDPGPEALYLGGDFTNIGGTAANGLAFTTNGLFTPVPGLSPNGGTLRVSALAVYDAPDPGPGDPNAQPPNDPPDPVSMLYIGGQFTAANRTNITRWDGNALSALEDGLNAPAGNIDGPVFALTVHDAPAGVLDVDPAADPEPELIIGGQFNAAGDLAGAGNLVSYGRLTRPQPPATDVPPAQQHLNWNSVGGGTDGPVFALTTWNPPELNGDPSTDDRLLVIGGQFTAPGNNIAFWVGGDLLNVGAGDAGLTHEPGGAVRALTAFIDEQETDIELDLRPNANNPQEALFVGGEFATLEPTGLAAPIRVNNVAMLDADRGAVADALVWEAMNGGVSTNVNADFGPTVGADATDPATFNPGVFALAAFDDGNPLAWDRHDRPDSRVQIIVQPNFGGFENTQFRVFDSNFNIIFDYAAPGSDRLNPAFPDPAGVLNPALSAPVPGTGDRTGFTLWGGETYYIVVRDNNGGGGTGRFNVSVTVQGMPPDIAGTRPDSSAITVTSETTAGNFSQALDINFNPADGLGSINQGTNVQTTGSSSRRAFPHPSVPSINTHFSDLGNITRVDDTDLWNFRAEFTGFVEIRAATRQITDAFGEWLQNFRDGSTISYTPQTKTYNSPLDTAIRVFDNDFTQIGYNDENYGVQGELANQALGTIPLAAYRRDSAIVIPVIAGNFYYVQVESGQRYKDGKAADAAQRVENVAKEIDWRRATGSYQLIARQMAGLQTDVLNGQTVQDDHNVGLFTTATPLPINQTLGDPNIGTGSATGRILNTPNNANDIDGFEFLSPGSGNATVRVRAANGSSLVPTFVVFNDTLPDPIAISATSAPGEASATFPASAGTRYLVRVFGNGTQGDYTISVSGIPAVDDAADSGKWANAPEITLQDFQGRGVRSGRIEAPGDSDAYRFAPNDFGTFTVDVEGTGGFDPTVSIYEVSEDPAGNPIFLRIAQNADIGGGNTNSRARFNVTPERSITVGGQTRNYPYYYVVVEGADRQATIGNYGITLSFPSTDDHPDAAATTLPARDTSEFGFATAINIDSTTGLGAASGEIERINDSDLLSFTASATGQATVTLKRPSTSLMRGRLTILASVTPGQPSVEIATVTSDDVASPTNGVLGTLSFAVSRGVRYYIAVDPFDQAGGNLNTQLTGAYSLELATPPVDDHANALEWSLATDIGISVSTNTGRVGGTAADDPVNARISYTGDSDLFRFTSRQTGLWSVTVQPYTSSGSAFVPLVRIYDSSFNLLQTFTGTLAGQQATIQLPNLANGTSVFVLVSAVSGGSITAVTGQFSVAVTGPTPGSGQGPGGTDPAIIDFNAPTVISLNPRTGEGQAAGSIEVPTARDLFRFRTERFVGTAQAFVQVVTPNGSLLDATVRVLRNPNELSVSEAAFDADGLPGVQANVAFLATGDTDYWIVVDGVDSSIGTYSVRVSTKPVNYRLFYPEGFTTDRTRETIAVSNPGNSTANFSVNIWYETGDLLLSLPLDSVAANSTKRIDLASAAAGHIAGLRTDTPYSIEIVSDQPLSATLAHYDFNGGVGDPFTSTLSPTWNFARVERTPGNVLDFIVFYNPASFDVDVTLTAYQAGRSPVTVTQRWGALRRGGWAINDIPQFPSGVFSVALTARAADSANDPAFEGVVASLSHYNLVTGSAFGAFGDQSSTVQAVPSFTQGSDTDSEIVVFNPGSTTATVQITGSYLRVNLTPFSRTIDVQPRSQVVLKGSDLGLVQNQPIGLRFASTSAVSVLASQSQKGDADATTSASQAGTRFLFGDGRIDTAKAGLENFEVLNFYNPTNITSSISVRLLFADGSTTTISVALGAGRFAELRLHERPEVIRDRSGVFAFGVDASSANPFVMSYLHYDLSQGGGWTTDGEPFGLVNPLARIPLV